MSNRVTQGEAVVGALQVETHARAASFEVDQEVGTIIDGPGVIKWNAVDETVDVGLNNGVTLQLGQEEHVRCANNHGVLIPNGTLVYMSGTDDTQDVPEILPFLGDGSIDPLLIVGVTTQDIANGEIGYVTARGFVHELNTTGSTVGETWTAGTALFASHTSAGALTKFEPTVPNVVTRIAQVIVLSATVGVIYVQPRPVRRLFYGEFVNTGSVSATAASTAYAIPMTSLVNGLGFRLSSSAASKMIADYTGRYHVSFSMQMANSTATTENVWIWPRIDGVDVRNATSRTSLDSNKSGVVPTGQYQVTLTAGQSFELMWAVSSTNLTISSAASTSWHPEVLGVMVTFNQVNV